MTFDEQAATMNRKSVAELLASHEHLTASSKAQSEEIAELRKDIPEGGSKMICTPDED